MPRTRVHMERQLGRRCSDGCPETSAHGTSPTRSSRRRPEALHDPLVPTLALGDEVTRLEPGAPAPKRSEEELLCRFDTPKVGVDLAELVLGHRSPSLVIDSAAAEQQDHLRDREARLLEQGDRRQPVQH